MSWSLRVRSRTFATAVLALTAACSSSDSLPAVDDPSSIEIAAGPDDVLLSFGHYDLGENVDGFVRGPDLVVYGDGSLYRDTARIGDDAAGRFQQGELGHRRLTDIVAAGQDLPTSTDSDTCGEGEA